MASRMPNGKNMGLTPLDRIAVARGFFHWKIEKDGFDAVEGCAGPRRSKSGGTCCEQGRVPPGMVRVTVPGRTGAKDFFFIDRYEVTNREFKEFVDAGGYRRPEFWQVPIMKDGKAVALDEALKSFVDSTGRSGPSTWVNGTYPTEESSFPVHGISWYEAAAYARFRGKELPTIEQWSTAASVELVGYIAPHSNMNSDGPAAVGSRPSPESVWCLRRCRKCQSVVPESHNESTSRCLRWGLGRSRLHVRREGIRRLFHSLASVWSPLCQRHEAYGNGHRDRQRGSRGSSRSHKHPLRRTWRDAYRPSATTNCRNSTRQ